MRWETCRRCGAILPTGMMVKAVCTRADWLRGWVCEPCAELMANMFGRGGVKR